MSIVRKTFFISDLHLEENHPECAHKFLHFLNTCDSTVDAIYILGDLFELWIGDDDHTDFNNSLIRALKNVTQALPIYILHGNRDFLIGTHFLEKTGCQLLSDETVIMLYDIPVLLMHGDTLCTGDIAYLKARKKMRNRFLQTIFLSCPLSLRKKIANYLRTTSKRYTATTLPHIMDVTQEAVMRVMQKHKSHHLVHGHTHKPGLHHFVFDHVQATRFVLGAWHHHGNALKWDMLGNKELITF